MDMGEAAGKDFRVISCLDGSVTWVDRAHLERCASDPMYFLTNHSAIKDLVSKEIIRYRPNAAQDAIYELYLRQMEEDGLARILVLKSRQLGVSTFTARLFAWHLLFGANVNCLAVVHKAGSLAAIRRDVYNRALALLDEGPWTPEVKGTSNNKEIIRGDLGRAEAERNVVNALDYSWASGADTVRGVTYTHLHLTEAGYYEGVESTGGDDMVASAMAGMGDSPGTMIIMESTSQGPKGKFFDLWQSADTSFGKVFSGVKHDPRARRKVPKDWEWREGEREYQKEHDVPDEFMVWRRKAMTDFGVRFHTEFPMTANDAFMLVDTGAFIPGDAVREAFRTLVNPDSASDIAWKVQSFPLVMGIDVAGKRDRTVVVRRRAFDVEGWHELEGDVNSKMEQIVSLMGRHRPAAVFLDASELGGQQMYEMITSLRYSTPIFAIASQSSPNSDAFLNKRAEMWWEMRDWFMDKQGQVRIFCSGEEQARLIQQELLVHTGEHQAGSGKFKMVDKKQIRQEIGRSPDFADALALTFAMDLPAHPQGNVFFKQGQRAQDQVVDFNPHDYSTGGGIG